MNLSGWLYQQWTEHWTAQWSRECNLFSHSSHDDDCIWIWCFSSSHDIHDGSFSKVNETWKLNQSAENFPMWKVFYLISLTASCLFIWRIGAKKKTSIARLQATDELFLQLCHMKDETKPIWISQTQIKKVEFQKFNQISDWNCCSSKNYIHRKLSRKRKSSEAKEEKGNPTIKYLCN